MSFIKGIKRKMSFSSSARTKSSSSESEELEKLGITRRSSIAQQDSLISYQDCILRYYQFMGCNVKAGRAQASQSRKSFCSIV